MKRKLEVKKYLVNTISYGTKLCIVQYWKNQTKDACSFKKNSKKKKLCCTTTRKGYYTTEPALIFEKFEPRIGMWKKKEELIYISFMPREWTVYGLYIDFTELTLYRPCIVQAESK